MTAEIAILNRAAVALAADSAVSLSVRGQQKIYNSIDKLFQLTPADPVGIMIFGSAEYMGIPLETIIKGFRNSKYCGTKDFIKDYAECFFQYLREEIDTPVDAIEKQICNILYGVFYSIRQMALDEYYEIAATAEHKKIDPQSFLKDKFIEKVKTAIETFNGFLNCESINEDSLYKRYPELAIKVATDIFSEHLKDSHKDIHELAKLILLKDFFSSGQTGFVFSGFGQLEIFPSLHSFNCDGMIGSSIKKKKHIETIIDRNNLGAHIQPFAQKEMVERFLDGIDPEYDKYIYTSMQQTLKDFGKEIYEASLPPSSSEDTEKLDRISKAVDAHLEAFYRSSINRRHEQFRRQILDMVHHMPKSDLAAMAESLVNLTSIKRRVSVESETVGGPVDVAVISKHDGFIWIRRKHYFNAELNPRYFTNQNNRLQMRRDKDEQ